MEVLGAPNIQALVSEFNFCLSITPREGEMEDICLLDFFLGTKIDGILQMVPYRDENAANDHQNVTLDHSYYANYAHYLTAIF